MLIGSLGQLIFTVSSKYIFTLNNLTKSKSANWIEHKIIGKTPKLQFDGANLDQIKFNMHLSYTFGVNPYASVQKAERAMKEGSTLTFILGMKYLGKYIIESIEETHKETDKFGIAISIDLAVNLKRYN